MSSIYDFLPKIYEYHVGRISALNFGRSSQKANANVTQKDKKKQRQNARLLKYLSRCRLSKQDIDGVKVKHDGPPGRQMLATHTCQVHGGGMGGCARVDTRNRVPPRRERERERRQANEHVCVIERDAGPLIKPLSSCKTSLPTPRYSQVMLHISRHCHPSGSWILLHNKHQPVVVYTHTHANDTQALSYRDYRGRPAQHTQTCRCAQKNDNKNPGLAVVRGWQGPRP